MPRTSAVPAPAFYRLADVLKIIPLSRSTFLDGVKQGHYPRPVRIAARASAWRAADIDELVERLSSGERPAGKGAR